MWSIHRSVVKIQSKMWYTKPCFIFTKLILEVLYKYELSIKIIDFIVLMGFGHLVAYLVCGATKHYVYKLNTRLFDVCVQVGNSLHTVQHTVKMQKAELFQTSCKCREPYKRQKYIFRKTQLNNFAV